MEFAGAGGTISINFTVQAYNDDFSEQLSTAPHQAGKYINLGMYVDSRGFAHAAKTFAARTCIVHDTDRSEKYTLFDAADAAKCENDDIDLDVASSDDMKSPPHGGKMIRITHLLFLLNAKRSNAYDLECNVVVCDVKRSGVCDALCG